MNNLFAQALSAALSYAVISRQVSEDGEPIGFLYREAATFPHDSGWRFFSGAEDDEYANNPDHFTVLPLNEVLDNNPEIAHLMNEQEGAWEWDDVAEQFVVVVDWQPAQE